MSSSNNLFTQTTQYNFDLSTGLLISSIDPNNQTTSYTYDTMRRPLTVNYPDGGSVTMTYPDFNTSTSTRPLNSTTSVVTTKATDGFGRTILSSVSAPGGADQVQSAYNYNGLLQTVTNPFQGSSPPANSSTSYVYDSLGRTIQQTHPDGSSLNSQFTQNVVDSYDEIGVHLQRTSDALGRLTQVKELGTTANPLALVTGYAYNPLGELLCVDQWGGAASGQPCANPPGTDIQRQFFYDSLSRLTSSSNPESGPITYSYVFGSANQLCAGDLQLPCSKTDARGVTVTYGYDSLNRLVSKTYPSGTASACYQYNNQSTSSATSANLVGRLISSWTQNGSCPSAPSTGALSLRSIVTYDQMGRVLSEQQCTRSNCGTSSYTPSYTYDYAGNIWTQSNGIGTFTFTNTYDTANHLLSITNNNIQYPTNLFSSPVYNAAGGLTNATLGLGLNLTRSYDSRLHITGETDWGNSAAMPTTGSALITITGTEQTH